MVLDSPLGYVEAFERNVIILVYFPPNLTSWKKPMDATIIEALRNMYQYFKIRDIQPYHGNPDFIRSTLGRSMKRGVVSVTHGKPTHLLLL